MNIRPAQLFLLVGDTLIFYAALALTLIIRYGIHFSQAFSAHLIPFTLLLPAWLVTFYVAGLYDPRRLRNGIEFVKTFSLALGIAVMLSMIFFYLFPIFVITPKRNLALFMLISAALHVGWRDLFNHFLGVYGPFSRVVMIGNGKAAAELVAHIAEHRQLGYEVVSWLKETSVPSRLLSADLIVCPREFAKDSKRAKRFYELLLQGTEVQDIPLFYEGVMRKVPLAEIREEWFLEHAAPPRPLYESGKRSLEFLLALFLGLALLPLVILIALLVRLTSHGPAIYEQIRVGRHGKPFTLYKFRTMQKDAEKDGPQWAALGDKRTTAIGGFLRKIHLDELPQLWNIIRGELSFVGPRPERPEFVTLLEDKIPFYQIRHIVTPGLTGWAQVNYPYGASVEDAYHKLEYEIFYLKYRSLLFDLAIMLKTIRLFFVNPKQKP